MVQARPPAVAGMFYPGSPGELRTSVQGMLLGTAAEPATDSGPRGTVKALIAPHAGYVYSGPVAASGFCRWAKDARAIQRIVLLGPAHHLPVRGLALPGAEAFDTPLGRVAVDTELRERIGELPQVSVNPAAHAPEHCLEVELPFLQVILGDFTILPLLVGRTPPEEIAEVLDRVWDGPGTRVVVSSDLSHYLSYDEARTIDRGTVERILALDEDIAPDRACGANAVNGLLRAARERRLEPELLDLRSSGDTAGDRSRVVGYAAVAFNEPTAADA